MAYWIKLVNLTVDLDGGTVTESNEGTYETREIVTLNEPTKLGYTFTGWTIVSGDAENSLNTLTLGEQDTEIKATWTPSKYEITFDANEGTVTLTSKEVTYLSTYGELPTPERSGYSFLGWYTEKESGEEIEETTILDKYESQTLYAHWIKNDYAYTGDYQEYVVPKTGYYKIELWGAQGGNSTYGGKGAYTSGALRLTKGEQLYIYVGGEGFANSGALSEGGYNGGGDGANGISTYASPDGYGGGGATDIRYFGAEISTDDLIWNSTLGLNSRIMIAAGGGGSILWNSLRGANGGTIQGDSSLTTIQCGGAGTTISAGTQTSGYAFGVGANGIPVVTAASCGAEGRGGGGGGYYGGYAQTSSSGIDSNAPGAGGSSFISGYAGVNAITSPTNRTHTNNTLHYSNKYFIDGQMQSGVNSRNGKAKITYIGETYQKTNSKLNNARYIKDCANGNSVNERMHWKEIQAITKGINVAYNKTVIEHPSNVETSWGTGDWQTITDGIVSGEQAHVYGSDTGMLCVTVDLGNSYDLDEIAVWHYYDDSRTYNNHSLYVSSDNTNWTTLINNVSGVVETANGIRVSAYD